MQLLKTYEEYDPKSDLSVLQGLLPQQPNANGAGTQSSMGAHLISASSSTLSSIASDGVMIRKMFYFLYLTNCMGLLVYWLSRTQHG
jgi:hypothetical protein